MSLKEVPPKKNNSNFNIGQIGLKDVRAGGDITISRLIQKICNLTINIPCSFSSQHRRFVLFIVTGVSIVCLLSGFKSLLEEGAILQTKLLLILGCGLPFLVCSYYVVAWKPLSILPLMEPPEKLIDPLPKEPIDPLVLSSAFLSSICSYYVVAWKPSHILLSINLQDLQALQFLPDSNKDSERELYKILALKKYDKQYDRDKKQYYEKYEKDNQLRKRY